MNSKSAQARVSGAVLVLALTAGYLAFMLLVVRPLAARFVARHDGARPCQGALAVVCVALLLSAGPSVIEIQRLLEKPAIDLTEPMLCKLRDIHADLTARIPDAAPYVAVIAMNRLLHPWQALKLPQFITRQTKDTLIANTDMGLVGELLLADIETHGNAVRATRHPVFDPKTLVEYLLRDNSFPTGCFLMTGTGIVPPSSFTLASGDRVELLATGAYVTTYASQRFNGFAPLVEHYL